MLGTQFPTYLTSSDGDEMGDTGRVETEFDGDDVNAVGGVFLAVGAEIHERSVAYLAELGWRDGFFGIPVLAGFTGLHFDENDLAAIHGDEVDFSELGAKLCGDKTQALPCQETRGKCFGAVAKLPPSVDHK